MALTASGRVFRSLADCWKKEHLKDFHDISTSKKISNSQQQEGS